MNRAYSILSVKSVKEDKRVIEGIASTPSLDRQGDIVEPMGARFSVPMPLLLDHDTRQAVGHVTFAKPNKDGIPFEAQIASTDEPGEVKTLLDKAWQLTKLKLRPAVSIGFLIDKYEIMKSGGWNITEWSWLELSLVSVPANADATITAIKSFDAERLAASGHKPQSERSVSAGVTASPSVVAVEAKRMKQTIAEQLSAFEASRAAKVAAMEKLMDDAAEKNETLDAAETETYDTLDVEVKKIDEHLIRLRRHNQINIEKAVPVVADTPERASDVRRNVVVQVRSALPKGQGFVRMSLAPWMAHQDCCTPAEIAASKGWGDDLIQVLKAPMHILKAAVAAGTTTDATWAGSLVVYQNLQNEFLELMRARSIIERIPGLRRVPFKVKVPRQTAGLTAYWVGEGSPKPVSKGAFDTVTLEFNKVAVLTWITEELARFSVPKAEQVILDSMVKDITYRIDRDFLDPTKTLSTGVSPASVTNGSTAITASGSTAAAFRSDLARALAAYSQANYGALGGLVMIMTETQAMRFGMMRTDFGQSEFPTIGKEGGTIESVPVVTSENIIAPSGSPADGSIIVLMNAPDILLADDGNVDVRVSREASIQASDSPDSPSTAATVMISMFQNNAIALLSERFITWQKARTDSVIYINNANYTSLS